MIPRISLYQSSPSSSSSTESSPETPSQLLRQTGELLALEPGTLTLTQIKKAQELIKKMKKFLPDSPKEPTSSSTPIYRYLQDESMQTEESKNAPLPNQSILEKMKELNSTKKS